MDFHKRYDDVGYQQQSGGSVWVATRITNLFKLFCFTLMFIAGCYAYASRYNYKAAALNKNLPASRDGNRSHDRETEPPTIPPAAQHLPRKVELPAPGPALQDSGPPSQLSESAEPLEPLVARERLEEPAAYPQLDTAQPPIGGMGTAIAGPSGDGAVQAQPEDAAPSILAMPDVHIDQSAPFQTAPLRRSKPRKPPPIRQSSRTLFDWLWGIPPTYDPRVMGWRGTGSAFTPPNRQYGPWQDPTWSPHAPDSMPWSMSPGDEILCRLGNCF